MTRAEHETRRSILAKLIPLMPPLTPMKSMLAPNFRDSYNRQLRARRTRRQAAWLSVILAGTLVTISFGILVDTLCSPLFSAIAVNILIAGIWGGYHLLTHH